MADNWRQDLTWLHPVAPSSGPSIGFHKYERTWYGWVDDLHQSFAIGDSIDLQHEGGVQKIKNLSDARNAAIAFVRLTREAMEKKAERDASWCKEGGPVEVAQDLDIDYGTKELVE